MPMWLKAKSPIVLICRFLRRPRFLRPYLHDLYMRRLAQGPEKYRPRSAWRTWSYESELIAFGKRLNENFNIKDLRICFTDKSYKNNLNDLTGGEISILESIDNENLAVIGYVCAANFICAFLRKAYCKLPEQWILTIKDRLLSVSELALIGAHLGIKDLLLYNDTIDDTSDPVSSLLLTRPPSLKSISNAFLAIIAVLHNSNSTTCHSFIRDFVLTRLTELDLRADFDFPMLEDPFPLLEGFLRAQNRSPPEPRLQWQSSMNTLLACYQVGFYSDKKLIGEAPGETLELAEKEAAIQSLVNLFGISDSRRPLVFSELFDPMDYSFENPSISYYLSCSQPVESSA